MLKWFSRKNNLERDIADLCNRAVAAWISTFPVDERLQDFLTGVPVELRDNVKTSAIGIFRAASAYLQEAADKGTVNLDEFYPALEKHLRSGCPWMGEPAFAALRSYTGWFAWHEGYSANGT